MIIKTNRLILRPMSPEDIDTVYEYSSDIENTRYMLYYPHRSRQETAEFLDYVKKQWESNLPNLYELAVVLEGTQIGEVFLIMGEDRSEAEIGWLLHKAHWGKGYTYEAALALIEYARTELGVKSIFAECDAGNVASENLMKKLGMRLEDADRIRKYLKRDETARELRYRLQLAATIPR